MSDISRHRLKWKLVRENDIPNSMKHTGGMSNIHKQVQVSCLTSILNGSTISKKKLK